MLTYFRGMGAYFYCEDGSIDLLGGGGGGGGGGGRWVEIFGGGDEYPHPPGFAPLFGTF